MIPKEHYEALELNQIFMTSVVFKHINDFCIKWAGDPPAYTGRQISPQRKKEPWALPGPTCSRDDFMYSLDKHPVRVLQWEFKNCSCRVGYITSEQ